MTLKQLISISVFFTIGGFLLQNVYFSLLTYCVIALSAARICSRSKAILDFQRLPLGVFLFIFARSLQTFQIALPLAKFFEILAGLYFVYILGLIVKLRIKRAKIESFLEAVAVLSTASIATNISLNLFQNDIPFLWILLFSGTVSLAILMTLEIKNFYEALSITITIASTVLIASNFSTADDISNGLRVSALSFLLMLGLITTKNNPTFTILSFTILGPLLSRLLNYDEEMTFHLLFTAMTYIPIGIAALQEEVISSTSKKESKQFGKKQMLSFLIFIVLLPLAYIRALTLSDTRLGYASLVFGVLGGTALGVRIFLLLRSREQEKYYEQELKIIINKLLFAQDIASLVQIVNQEGQYYFDKQVDIKIVNPQLVSENFLQSEKYYIIQDIHFQEASYLLVASSPKPLNNSVEKMIQKLSMTLKTILNKILANKKALEILQQRAERDPLTGMLNRTYFMKYAEERLETEYSHQKWVTIFIDINDFKQINDRYGHDIGDLAIQKVATIIQKSIRNDDLAARLGGDEFIMLIQVDTPEQIEERIHKLFPLSLQLQEEEIWIYASTGVVEISSGCSLKDSIKNADSAMYKNKKSRTGNTPPVHKDSANLL